MDFSKVFHSLDTAIGRGPQWLIDLRHQGLLKYEQLGWPNSHWEDWKHTDLSKIQKREFGWPRPIVGLNDLFAEPEIRPWIQENQTRLVFLNGHYCQSLSRCLDKKGLVTVMPLSELIRSDSSVIGKLKSKIGSYPFAVKNPFVAMNQAFLYEASVVWVPDQRVIEEPIHIIHISKGAALFSYAKTFILVDSGGQANVNEIFFASDSQDCFSNAATEIHIADGGHLNITRAYSGNDTSLHLSFSNAILHGESQLHSFVFSSGGDVVRHELQAHLIQPRAEAYFSGVSLAKDESSITNQIDVRHQAPQTISHQTYKSILADQAKSSFNGKILVNPDCAQVEATQLNKNLILSKRAEANTRPQLEIYCDDVKCTHGATVGELSDDELFYLQSRGISGDAAVEMLSRSFAEEVFFDIPDQRTQENVRHLAQDFFCGLKWNREGV